MIISQIYQAKIEQQEQVQKSKEPRQDKGKGKKPYRGDDELEIVSEKPFVPINKLSHLTEFKTQSSPFAIYEALDEYRAESQPGLKINIDDKKKHILI